MEQSAGAAHLIAMELYFNELSLCSPAIDRYAARERMRNFLLLCREARDKGFRVMRVARDFDEQALCERYAVRQWYMDAGVSRTQKDFFLGFRKFPYEPGDAEAEDDFLEATYRLHEPEEETHHGRVTEGLAWAYIRQTLCISFPEHPVWRKTVVRLLEQKAHDSTVVSVVHASVAEHIAELNSWIERVFEPVLVESALLPAQKRIALRDDHGKETLHAFAKRLVHSPYVEGIINSLPFNPHARSFIRKTYTDGRIELVLLSTDQGLGLVVQSTGRTLRETEAIADILKDTYM
jgi:hypothetical protein